MPQTPSLVGTGTIATPARYGFRGVQTDPNGTVFAGHKSTHDFASAVAAKNSFAISDTVTNLVTGGAVATCSGTFGTGQTAAKGLLFTTSTSDEVMELAPADGWDMEQLGSEPSFVMSFWVTQKAYDDGTATRGIAGYARFTTTYCQWSLSTRYQSGNYTRFRLGGVNSNNGHNFGALPLNTPTMITAVVRRTGTGTFTVQFMLGSTVVASYAGVYPFVDPLGGGTATTPRFGAPSGYNADLSVVVHRAQLFRIDPSNFDAEFWAANEIAAQAGRFV